MVASWYPQIIRNVFQKSLPREMRSPIWLGDVNLYEPSKRKEMRNGALSIPCFTPVMQVTICEPRRGGDSQIKKGQGSSSELLKKTRKSYQDSELLRFRGLPLLHPQKNLILKQHIFYHIFCFTVPALYPEGTAKASAVEIMRLNTLKRTRTTFLTLKVRWALDCKTVLFFLSYSEGAKRPWA